MEIAMVQIPEKILLTEPKSHRRRIILRGLRGGLGVTQIARALKITTATVSHTLTRWAPELKVGRRKWSDEQIAAIRRLWEAGERVPQIAEARDVTSSTIKGLARRNGFPARTRGRPLKVRTS